MKASLGPKTGSYLSNFRFEIGKTLFFIIIICFVPVLLIAQADCVSGISVSPSIQTVCSNSAATPITATITITPNSTGGNITYQWYSNASNSTSGGTLVQTTSTTTATTSDTYTPSTTTAGSRWYYCIVTNLGASCPTPTYITTTSSVIVQTPPTINLSASPSGAICEGTNVTFTATSLSGTYQWKVNGTDVGTNTNTYSSASLANGDIISIAFTSNTSCTTPVTKQLTMIVNSAVVPQVSIDASEDNICEGTSVTFTASPVNGGASPLYQWKVNGLNVGSGGSTYITTSLSNGDVVTVDMKSNAVCAALATVTSNSIPVTVYPNQPVSVSIAESVNNICTGTPVTFTATAVNKGSSPVYQWKVNGIDVGTNSATFTTTALANNDAVTVELTSDVTPCAAGNPATSNVINMVVNPVLPVSVSIASSSTSICPGNSVTFTATPVNGGTNPYYQWKVNGINAGTNSATFTTTTLANNDVVSVELTSNASPCVTGNPATSNNLQVTVNPILPVSVSITASATTICTGNSVAFTATPVNGGTSPSYQWKVNGVNAGTNSPTFTTASLVNNDQVTVVLTSNATPCASGSPASSNSVKVTVNARPTPTFTTSPAASVCSGSSVTYTTQSGFSNYVWSVPGIAGTDYTITSGGIGTGNNTVTLTWLTAGSKNVSVNYNNALGCNGSSVATSITAVNQTLAPSVSISSPTTSVCVNPAGSATFTAAPVNGGISPTYQWKVSGNNVSGATGATYTKSSWNAGNIISVVMTSNYACVSPATATSNAISVTVWTGRPDNIASNSITGPTSICPPVSGLVYTVTAVTDAETYVWQLPTGFTITSGSGTNTITVSVASNATIGNGQNVTVYASNPCGQGNPKTLSVNVNNFAGVDAGPDQNVCAGSTITLAGAWSGNTSSSTWSASSGGFSNAGLTNSTYTPSISSGAVTLTITTNDPVGTCPAVSDQMVVNVNQPPAITSQPATQTVCSGSNVTLSVAATGTGLTYQWKKNGSIISNDANVSGVTTSSLTLSNVTNGTGGAYSVTVTGASPCASVTSSTATLTVNTAVSISAQPAVTQNACAGGPISFTVASSGSGLTFQWRKGTTNLTNGGNISGATSSTLTLNPVALSDAASDYNVVISGTAPCTPVTSNNAALVVYEPVSINTQPLSQTVCSGTPVTLTTDATGSGLTYQWRRNGVNVSNGGGISGATTATLSILSAATVNAGAYTVLVAGVSPCAAVTSATANLVVNQVVGITTQPVTKTVCSGSSTTLTVVATGTGLTYQWRKGTTNLTDNSNISGTNSATLTFNPVLVGDAASDYNVIVSGASPCSPVTSNNAVLVVNEAVTINTQPLTQAVCSGSNVTLSVSATGLGLTYQWKKNGGIISNGANVSGATTSSLTLSNVTTTATGNYTVLVTGTAPCMAVTSSTAVLTVNQAIAITTQPANVSICGTNPVDFTVVATGTGLSYQWYKSPGIPVVNTGNISGATTNNLHFAQGTAADNGSYYVVVSGASPCPPVTSLTKILDVNESISITTQPVASQKFCVGLSAGFEVVASASDPLNYQWRKNGINIPGATASTYSIPVLTVADAGNYDVLITGPAGYTCSVAYSAVSSLIVTAAVGTPSFTAGAATVCQDAANELYTATATGNTGITYSVSPASAGVIHPVFGIMNWDAAFVGTATITATATGCYGPSTANKVVTVNPKPVVTSAATGVVCSGIAQNYTSTSNVSGATWLWSRGAVTGISNPAVSGQTANPITESLVNTASSPVDVVYAITPVFGGCSGNPLSYTVTVNPLPTASISGTTTVCANASSPLITFAGAAGTAPYTFTYNVNGGSNQTITTVSGNSVTLSAPTATAGTFTYSLVSVKDASSTACTQSQTGSAIVTVMPGVTLTLLSAAATTSQSVCINTAISSINYTLGGGATNVTFSGLPAGVSGSVSGGNVTISGIPSAPGVFTYSVQTTGSCSQASATGSITVNAVSVGGTTNSSTNLFACSGVNAGTVLLTGQTGIVVKWQSSVNGGLTWTDINSTASSITYTNLTQTTWYRAAVTQPTCSASIAYSTHTVVNVVPITTNLNGIASPSVICSGFSTLTANGTALDSTLGELKGGSFDQAGAPLEGDGLWRAYEGNNLHNISGSANNGVNPFNLTNGPKEFFSSTPGAVTYNNNPLDGQSNNNKFMVANGPVNSTLESPIFSLVGLSKASFDWYEAYILEAGASLKMEISLDGGNTYNNTIIRPDVTGPATRGIPTNFIKSSVDLSAYAGLSNLRVRFTYAGTAYSSWGLEQATITKPTVTSAYTWNLYQPAPVTGTPAAHYLNVFTSASVTVTPPSPNTTNAPITYYYSLTSSDGGCASNIAVTVNPSPRITHSTVSPVCSGSALSPGITFTSTLPGTTYTYTVVNPGGITGLVTNANGTISGTPVNSTATAQTIRFIVTGTTTATSCPGIPDTVDIVVNPNVTVALSGTQTVCAAAPNAILTLTSTGPFPFDVTLSNGVIYTMSSSPFYITLSPSTTTNYTISSLSGACYTAGALTGNANVSVISLAGITGTWVCGAGDRDWFNPCNWANGIVPDNTINVIIASVSSSCDPVINPLSPFAATYGPIARSKNITISGSRNLSFSNGGDLHVAGNWLNNVGSAGFTANTGTVTMMGSVLQTITTTIGSTEAFYNLSINNSSSVTNGVTLNSNVTVSNTLTLTNGIVNTHSNPPPSQDQSAVPNKLGLLTMTFKANPVAGSPGVNSFINGQMAREFNSSGPASEYAYPIGKVIGSTPVYKDMAVQPATVSGVTTFTSEYFPTAHPAPSVMLGVGLIGIVPEYWQVDQSGGTANAMVKIPYANPGNGNWIGNDNNTVTDPCSACNVAVVRKDISSSGWNFTAPGGNFSSTGPQYRFYQDNGYIYSAVNSSFGPFTNGYAYNVILPVQLITFDAKLINDDGVLSWTIADGKELGNFELQHSLDGNTFTSLAAISVKQGSTQYDYQHRRLAAGSHYYRLLVREKSGKNFYSKTLMVMAGKDITVIIGLQPTLVQSQTFVKIYSAKQQTVYAELMDITGRKIGNYKNSLSTGENKFSISTTFLAKGVYTLQVQTDDGVRANLRFMKE